MAQTTHGNWISLSQRTNHPDAPGNLLNGNTHPMPRTLANKNTDKQHSDHSPATKTTDKQHSDAHSDHTAGIRRSAKSEKPTFTNRKPKSSRNVPNKNVFFKKSFPDNSGDPGQKVVFFVISENSHSWPKVPLPPFDVPEAVSGALSLAYAHSCRENIRETDLLQSFVFH